jgi:hypothetical protein
MKCNSMWKVLLDDPNSTPFLAPKKIIFTLGF